MTQTLIAAMLAALVTVGCGGAPGTLPDADADVVADGGVDVDISDAVTDVVLVPDTTVPDATPDVVITPDAATDAEPDSDVEEPDADVPDGDAEPEAGTPDAAVPVAYRVEIWGFQVPPMRRRLQAAAPGYTNWQTHDPEACCVELRGPDVVVRAGIGSPAASAPFNNTFSISGTTSALYTSADFDLEDAAMVAVNFRDYEQNGDITPIPVVAEENIGGCSGGWMTPAAIANSLATGNIQTTSCAAPTHSPSGVTMLNADIVVEWRVVAVY